MLIRSLSGGIDGSSLGVCLDIEERIPVHLAVWKFSALRDSRTAYSISLSESLEDPSMWLRSSTFSLAILP